MPRDHFFLLLKYIHFADNNDTDAKTNKLYKIGKIVNVFNTNSQRLLDPGTEIVIDETMVPWQGRLSFKQ